MKIVFSDMPMEINKENSIFLAGPTLRNSTFKQSWRKEACNILEELGYNGILYVPEFSNGKNPFDFMNQVEWEREGLVNASKILFYIPRKLPELPGFTTNVEFGMYLAKRPEAVVLCSPEGAEKNRYLEWLYSKECPSKKIYKNLKEVLVDTVNDLESR